MRISLHHNTQRYKIDEFGRLWEVTGRIKSLVVYPDKELEKKAIPLGYKAKPLENLVYGGFHNHAMRNNR